MPRGAENAHVASRFGQTAQIILGYVRYRGWLVSKFRRFFERQREEALTVAPSDATEPGKAWSGLSLERGAVYSNEAKGWSPVAPFEVVQG